jgi:hypothetical protein
MVHGAESLAARPFFRLGYLPTVSWIFCSRALRPVISIAPGSLSVPTNIAESSKRSGRHDYARFLNIAEGALAEPEYLLMVSRDLGYITPAQTTVVLDDV